MTALPAPSFSASFLGEIVRRAGGSLALSDENVPIYAWPGMLASFVSFEKAGLHVAARRDRISEIFKADAGSTLPRKVKQKVLEALGEPAREAIARACLQFQAVPPAADPAGRRLCLIAVNSGPESLPADLFKLLVSEACREEAVTIGAALCLTMHHHRRPFDHHFLFDNDVLGISMEGLWAEVGALSAAADACFDEAMAALVGDQANPALWAPDLGPIVEVVFHANGPSYIRG